MNRAELNYIKEQLGSDGKFVEIKPYHDIVEGKDYVTLECFKKQRNFEFSLYWLYLYKGTFIIKDNLDSLAFSYIHKYFPFADKAIAWTCDLTTESYHIKEGHKLLNDTNGNQRAYDFDCTYIIKVPKHFNVYNLNEKEIENAILYVQELY